MSVKEHCQLLAIRLSKNFFYFIRYLSLPECLKWTSSKNVWLINIMTILGLIALLLLFAESGGQTPGNFEGKNIAGNLKGSMHNFPLSIDVNILVSVTDSCKVLFLLLISVSHKLHD